MKIAVIGSGISGLSAAWLLSKKHDVQVFEAGSEAGGHSNTRTVETPDGEVNVDSGFIVYNEKNYPNLTAFFSHLDVATHATDMSFAFSLDGGRYEYNGNGLRGLFGQRANVVNLEHWRMIRDIQRFFRDSKRRIANYDENIELGTYLQHEGFSRSFLNNHILPMAGAIWSSPSQAMELFPARSFLNFYANHGLLQIDQRPKWRSVLGGSRQYVNKIVANSEFNLHLNCPVALVRRETDQVIVHTKSGEQHKFDEVVFACHADAALGLLANPTPLEHELLGKFSYSNNLTVMHTDESQMPRRKRIWSSWNYLANREGAGQEEASSVTYWMNNLQRLPTNSDIFVSVNPDDRINKEKVLYATEYRHPVFTVEAVGAQKALWNLQGRNRSWFCGSYFGYGFHEDGLQSGLAVAEQLGGEKRPWQVADESGRIHLGSQPWLEAAE